MRTRIVGWVALGILIGAVVGPPVVNAATQLVTIKSAGSNAKAKVTGQGAIKVDTEASVGQGFLNTFALTFPAGVATIAEGSANTTVPADVGLITNVVVDLPTGQGAVTVTLTDDIGEIWQGTVDGTGRHLNDTFDNGLIWVGNLRVALSATGAEFSVTGVVVGGAQTERSAARSEILKAVRR